MTESQARAFFDAIRKLQDPVPQYVLGCIPGIVRFFFYGIYVKIIY